MNILAIDQGTTSSRAIVFDQNFKMIGKGQSEFEQFFPQDGWVEHDPKAIWKTTLESCISAIAEANISAQEIAGVGITNQRETTLIWDRKTGECVYRAIVWQDRRTQDFCEANQQYSDMIQAKTGLRLDPYFSGTKIKWILDHVPGVRERAEKGELAFGTVDTFLLWQLTKGKVHATDATNASRTLLFNIHRQAWDSELLKLFDIPMSLLPEVKNCADDYGMTDPKLFGFAVPIRGIAGDQSAAMIGQDCLQPGLMKCTFGTGAFMMLNTGSQPIFSKNKLLTTVGYRLNNQVTYALEGSVFIAGAGIKWLRDKLGLIQTSQETQVLAESVESSEGVYFVPALTGLGAPYWRPEVRGMIIGLSRNTSRAHIVRATLEAVAFQTQDLLDAMQKDGALIKQLRIDGGMVQNNWFCQCLSDLLEIEALRPKIIETTALGVAYLVAISVGRFKDWHEIDHQWEIDLKTQPGMDKKKRAEKLAGWRKAVNQLLGEPFIN